MSAKEIQRLNFLFPLRLCGDKRLAECWRLGAEFLNHSITKLPIYPFTKSLFDSCLFAKFAAAFFDLRSSAEICGEDVWLTTAC
jgi:hypothetical protein